MASISVVDMHQRYKRVQSLQRKIKRQIPNDQRDATPEEWMYYEYERVCADLEETLSIMQTSFTSRFGAITDPDTSIRERIRETLELISTSDLSDSLLLRLRGGTDLSPAFQTIEINILVFCGVPLKDAFEIVKRTPPLQEVISDSGAFFLTPSMFVVPIMLHYRNFRNLLSNTIGSMLHRLREIEIHQGLAILFEANKQSSVLFPSFYSDLSMFVAHFASVQEAIRAKIDLSRAIPELS